METDSSQLDFPGEVDRFQADVGTGGSVGQDEAAQADMAACLEHPAHIEHQAEKHSRGNHCPTQCRRPPPAKKRWSAEEVQSYAHDGDCWLIAHGKVYDATDFVDRHPGGPCILKRAGQDATRDFDFHSRAGQKEWSPFCIGTLEGSEGFFGKVFQFSQR
jgi:cytochrome b involved in lipid metabolism